MIYVKISDGYYDFRGIKSLRIERGECGCFSVKADDRRGVRFTFNGLKNRSEAEKFLDELVAKIDGDNPDEI